MADNFDNYSMKVQARVDLPSNKDIDAQIRKLEKSISKLKVSGQFDDTALRNLTNQLNTLKANITTANFSPTALTELTNQVNRALQNINIGNINVGNVNNQAQQVGQQIGNNIGQQITQSISSAIQKGTMTIKNADGTIKDLSKYIPSGKLLQNDVAKEALKDFQALGVGIVTVKEEMKNIDGKNLLNGFTINIKNAKGEVESLRYALTDIEGKTGKMFQYVGGSINDNGVIQQMNTISAKADSLQTKLDKMKASYSDLNASRPIKDSGNISALSQQYDKVAQAIENVRSADNATFSSMVSNAQREITTLESMVSQFRNAENVATQMKSVDISSGIAQAQERLGKLKANASGFDQMKQTIVDLDTAIANVGDKSSLDAFINKLKVAESQLGRVKAETKVNSNAIKEQEILANAMAKGREQAELSRQAEQKRQQMAQNNAINKALEQEYQERQKNIEAARKQAELDKQNALAFTKSASERLSSAISKYSYGDTSDANAMMKQMNRGLSNFGNLSNVQGNITQLSSTVDKIIADLKLSHEQSLQALNQEIKAEQTLQSQKDAFNKRNLNAIDYEIQKREQEAKAFSSMLQAQMQEQQKMQANVDEIQLSFDDGTYEAKYDSLIAKTRQWINANDESVISTQRLTTAYNEFNQAATAYAKDGSVANRDKLIQKEEELARQIKATTNEVKSYNAEYAKSSKIDSLHQKIQEFYDKNTATHRKWGAQLKNMLNETSHGAQLTATRVNEIEQEFLGVGNAARQAGKLGDSFFGGIKKQAGQFLQWFSVISVIMEGVQQVRKMVNEVKTLDNAMMDLTMATGYNKSQIEDLMDTYFKLGDKLSATASDVAASADTWLRQGKSIAETNKLIEDSMVLSKIGGLSSEDSTKYLTSVMKGYKVATEDVIGVVDKLSAVDMASATDVGGLAEGMSEVAASADLAGVSMDKLLGYLATIGEVTQSGMSEVGTTLNAVFARMGNIKLSRLKDYETGEDLSNVETVLRGVGINLRDSMNSFRDFDEVLDETASNWNNYSEVQQRAIAQAFSGTHHMNEFIILMENYDTALKYTETSLGSTGQAMEKFEAYEESIAGHTEKFKNAFQDLSNSVIDSGLINFFIDLGTTGIKAVDGLVDALGGLGAIGAIGGGILGAKNIGKVYECTFSNCFEYALHT